MELKFFVPLQELLDT